MIKKLRQTAGFLFVLTSHAQTLELDDQTRQQVRNFNRAYAKQTCISFFTESNSKLQVLSNLGIALADQCRCTEDAASYLVSDELAAYTSHGLYEARTNGWDNLDTSFRSKIAEHTNILMTAMQDCSRKLMNKR